MTRLQATLKRERRKEVCQPGKEKNSMRHTHTHTLSLSLSLSLFLRVLAERAREAKALLHSRFRGVKNSVAFFIRAGLRLNHDAPDARNVQRARANALFIGSMENSPADHFV